MTLYVLEPHDVADLLALVSSSALTITANNAARLAQLQQMLATAQPSTELAELAKRHEVLGKDFADLHEQLEKARAELEVTHAALLATERQRQEWIERANSKSMQSDAERMHADDDMSDRVLYATPSTQQA